MDGSRETGGMRGKMAKIRPFRAYRPKKGLEERIAALPYDVYSSAEAGREVKREPLSFLAIDRAETTLAENTDPACEEVYEAAAALLAERIREGIFVQDEAPFYYIYELEAGGRAQTGIVACASVDDYQNGVIRRHENTRQDKEEDRVRHVEACNAQTGPIFLAYRAREEIRAVTDRYRREIPSCDFTSPDGVSHRVWIIKAAEDIRFLQEAFERVSEIYIADGHHRCASAVRVALKRRAAETKDPGEREYNYILSVLFPDDELRIMDYNRLVKDLGGLTEQEFLRKVEEIFVTEEVAGPFRPERKEEFGMYLPGHWYRLHLRAEETAAGRAADRSAEHREADGASVVESLAVSVLQNRLLEPVLGIRDPKTDSRIDFVGGIRGPEELERRCHEDCAVAFSVYPTSIEELFAVADAGLLMPPKSTWFEPKLRSGLFLHSLAD